MKANVKMIIGRHKLITIGVIVVVASIGMRYVPWGIYETMQACISRPVTIDGRTFNAWPPGLGNFEPGATFTSVCAYEQDIGQDLIFWGHLTFDAYPTPISSHVEIRDPTGNIIAEQNFDSSRVVLQVKPEAFGDYTATITNLQAEEDRFVKRGVGYSIHYGFGHFTSYAVQGANNPVGDVVVAVIGVGTFITLPGFVIIGFGVYRKFRRGKIERPIE